MISGEKGQGGRDRDQLVTGQSVATSAGGGLGRGEATPAAGPDRAVDPRDGDQLVTGPRTGGEDRGRFSLLPFLAAGADGDQLGRPSAGTRSKSVGWSLNLN